ncbi:MAG: hypothetical protein ACLR1T_01655 [Evtepia gabavorous]
MLLALALEPIPQILILDEPLSGVDVGESICCWICWTRSGRNMISPSSSPPTISPPCAIMLTRSSSFSRPF